MDSQYFFEFAVFLVILVIMLMSSQPKKAALFVCVVVACLGLVITIGNESGLISTFFIYPIAATVEGLAGMLLVYLSRFVIQAKERRYFYIMAGFLFASGGINSAVMTLYNHSDLFSFSVYTFFFHSVAVMHILAMLILSDGSRTIIRNLRDFGYTLRNGISRQRG